MGSLILSSGLLIALFVWCRKYKNLGIYPMNDTTKELFFWTAVLFSNSLSTAFGDLLTKPAALHGLNLGTLNASFVELALIIILITMAHINLKKSLLFLKNPVVKIKKHS